MDWSKAKTILIVVLLVFCLALGSILYQNKVEENKEAKQNVAAAEEYLKSINVENYAQIPTKRPAMEVLFVEYNEAEKDKGELIYKDYPVYTNTDSSAGYSITSTGESKAKITSASSAVIEAVTRSKAEKQILYGVELCYYINSGKQLEDGSSDTAVPAWRIYTNEGYTYILAY